MSLRAEIAFLKPDRSPIGRTRIRLLEAVARSGSISGAARAVGLTYKAAWDNLDAMANVFGAPLVAARAGGKAGGGAALTPAGQRVIELFFRMEAELAGAMARLAPEFAQAGVAPLDLLSGFVMKTSARNVLSGQISALTGDGLNCEVSLALAEGLELVALVTQASVRELGLMPGRRACALIKAPFVAIAAGDTPPRTSARNCIPARVKQCQIENVSAEVALDIGAQRTLIATITAASAQGLQLSEGARAYALIDAAHILIALV
jgi:molybdate transport system regulatory protein